MSTSVVRLPAEVAVTQFAWQSAVTALVPPTDVRPLLSPDPDHESRRAQTRDLVVPSLLDQRSAAAEREGYDRGFREGERAGQESARIRAEAMLVRLASTIDQVAALRSSMLRKSEQDIVRLAVAVAERIVRREVHTHRDLLPAMARAAAARLGDSCVATILMNPDDFMHVASGRGAASDAGPIRLVADPSLPPGGCVVQSAFGNIDASVEGQIRELLRGFLGEDPETDGPATAGGPGARA